MYTLDRLHYSIRGSYHVWDKKGKEALKLAPIHGHGMDVFNGMLSINYGKGAKFSFTPREITAKFEGGEQNITLFGTDGTFIKGKGKGILVEFAKKETKFDYQIIQNGVIGWQFAPFDALKGLKEAIAAKEKRPEPRRELTDYMKEQINNTLTELRKGQQVTVVYYGTMEQETLQITGTVMKVDPYWQTLQVNKVAIDFSEIYEITQ